MKKVIALVLTILMLHSVTACSNEDVEGEKYKETKETTEYINTEETISNKNMEYETNKVISDAEAAVDEKDTIVNTEDETTSKTDATTGETESDTKAPVTQSTILAEPATEITTTSKPVQVQTEPTTTKPVVTEPTTTKPSHTHSWQPVYKTVIITEAWDEPIYEETPVYEIHKVHHHSCYICVASPFYITDGNNIKGVDLTEAYKYWLEIDGVGCYGDGSWRDFKTEVGTYGYACDTAYATAPVLTGYASQIVGYTHHDAVTEMYIDYYYCADNSCGVTKEGDK